MRERSPYLVTTRTTGHGRHASLEDAMQAVRALAGEQWEDQVIWFQNEVVAVILAGGEVIPVQPAAWSVLWGLDDDPNDADDPEIIDLDQLDPPFSSEAVFWEE